MVSSWLDSEGRATGFADGLDVVCEKKRKVISDSKDFVLSNLKDRVDIY